MQTLSEIKGLLASHGLRPRRRFGQNFLHDRSAMERVAEAAGVQPGDRVLEVGPGTGSLTERLLQAGARVVAVEVDRDLAGLLRDRLEPWGVGEEGGRVELIEADVLAGKHRVEPRVLEAMGTERFLLVANLPYNVASPLLLNLAVQAPGMSRAVVMVQREVADRIVAGPGSKAYGALGVLLQAQFEARRLFTLPPGVFWPPPKVDSAVVRLDRLERPLTHDPAALSDLVGRLFGQRRKQLGSLLGRDTPLPPGLEPTMRPEQASVPQLCELARM